MDSAHADLWDCLFALTTEFQEDSFVMNFTTDGTKFHHFDMFPPVFPSYGASALAIEFQDWHVWSMNSWFDLNDLEYQNFSTKLIYLPLKFVVKWVTSLNSLMSTDSLACDQNRTARTCSRLRTASLHLGVEVIAPVYCQPEDAQWKHMARSCLHHLLPNLHRANQHDKALALLCVWCSIF